MDKKTTYYFLCISHLKKSYNALKYTMIYNKKSESSYITQYIWNKFNSSYIVKRIEWFMKIDNFNE